MKIGVVYKHKIDNKINGTLFYCFEYLQQLRHHCDAKLYIVGIPSSDLSMIKRIFEEKYTVPPDHIVPVVITDLYKLGLERTLVLDVHTFNCTKEFLTNQVHVFSNDEHNMYRYKNSRTVTYYGMYPYQRYDVPCILKINFDIFHPCKTNSGVFISALDHEYIKLTMPRWEKTFNKPIYLKVSHSGSGSIFDRIDQVHYVHTCRDTNNRIIPEAFYHGKTVTVEDIHSELDSIMLRYNDITENGLGNYTLTDDDVMVQACLR